MADRKLFPPILETKLPAFAEKSSYDEETDEIVYVEEMQIPFQMNKTVAIGDISKMSLIVKAAQTGKKIGVLTSAGQPSETASGFTIGFDSSSLELQVGQYYKVQLAYVDTNNNIGYYSQAGIIKKTSAPQLEILELKDNISISNRFEYTGHYIQTNDPTEKVYSYQFTITDLKDNIISTSGELLHDSSNDELGTESKDVWQNNIDLIFDESYNFKYKVTTINGYSTECSYTVTTTESVNIDLNIDLDTKLNYEDGLIELYLLPRTGKISTITGDFVLVRSTSLTNFKQWDPVEEFHYINVELTSSQPLLLWEDYLVHHGETYRYAIQAYNSNHLFSNRLESKSGAIQANFEHCFLSDADHQLKIKFNPKISSFKTTVVESKVNTLGSKYPFIFKNGYVEYKEFPISGLLSLLSDENGKFNSKYSQQDRFQERTSSPGGGQDATYFHDLSDSNIYNERQFKNEVLDWLNNGQPKLFRSATEGNFIVRLMNSSLSPNDTLGRMLHTFSTTACEIADYNFNNIKNLKLISSPRSYTSTVRVGQIIPSYIFADSSRETNYPKLTFFTGNIKKIGLPPSYSISIADAEPGTRFKLNFYNIGDVEIEIGGTGSYIVPIAKKPSSEKQPTVYLQYIELTSGEWRDTKVNFEYYEEQPFDTFSEICDITIKDEIRRFVGIDFNKNLISTDVSDVNDFNRVLNDIKRDVGRFHFIRIEKRFVQEMWLTADGKYSRTEKPSTDIIQDDEWNPLYIYHDNTSGKYYDGHSSKAISGEPDYRFSINDEINYNYFGVNPTEDREDDKFGQSFGRVDSLRNIDKVTSLKIGNGLMIDVAYRVKIKEYSCEEVLYTQSAYKNYMSAKLQLQNLLKSGSYTKADYESKLKSLNQKYKTYITALTNKLKETKGG